MCCVISGVISLCRQCLEEQFRCIGVNSMPSLNLQLVVVFEGFFSSVSEKVARNPHFDRLALRTCSISSSSVCTWHSAPVSRR